MQPVNSTHLSNNINDSEPSTSHDSIYSGSSSKVLATSVDSLAPTKTCFNSECLTSTSSELQNGQLMPTNFAQDMEAKCFVCGHPSKFRHYGVPSCNGCQSFFRRSLLEPRTYACLFNEMCSKMKGINRCRACRFDRCVLAGMNPQAIQLPTTVDVAKLSDKVSNRRRYLLQKYGEICPVLIGKTGPVFEETIEDNIIQSLIYGELKVRQIRESSRYLNNSVIFRSVRELLESCHENVLAHADQYPKELKWPLTFEEAVKLEASEIRPHWFLLDMFLSIEMARTLPVFSQLDYNDQEALLKHVILASNLLLEAFYSYQMKSDTFIMPTGFLPTKPPKNYRRKDYFASFDYGKYSRITDRMEQISCRTMEAISRIQMTMEEFVLLKAIIYSHSAIHGLSVRGRVLLQEESARYSKTLMKHLQSRMGAAPGAKKYAEIVYFIGCLFHCAQQQREMHVYISTVLGAPVCYPQFMETIMNA